MVTVLGTLTLVARFYNGFEVLPRVDVRTPWIAGVVNQNVSSSSKQVNFTGPDVLAQCNLPVSAITFLESSTTRDKPWCGAISLSPFTSSLDTEVGTFHGSSSRYEFLVTNVSASGAADGLTSSMRLINQTLPPATLLNTSAFIEKAASSVSIETLRSKGLKTPDDLIFNGSVTLVNGLSVLSRAFDRYWMLNPSKPQLTTSISDVVSSSANGETAYTASIDATWTSVSEIEMPVTLLVVMLEDGSIQLTDSIVNGSSAGDTFNARAKELSDELLAVAVQRDAGVDAKVPLRDLRAEFDAYDPVTKAHAFEWLVAYDDAVQQVNTSKLGANEAALLQDYETNKIGEETLAEYLTRKTSEQEAAPGTSIWADAWKGIKGVTAKAGDYVSKWSPVELVAGYAGYKTVSSIEKSGIPSWMLYGGIGLVALMIIK